MKDLLVLLAHLLTTLAKLLGPGGIRAVVADSLLMKQKLLVISRCRRRGPHLSVLDRFLLGFWSLFLTPRRIQRAAVIIRPSTLLRFHEALRKRKYRLLYSSPRKGKPGPKRPSPELIRAMIALKQRNPRFGCPRIALIISKTFGVEINKDVVRRVLATHYRPGSGDGGPSWLTFIGHMKDSLWSVDLLWTIRVAGGRLTTNSPLTSSAMITQPTSDARRTALGESFKKVRQYSETICAPLAPDDYQIQSIVETSPPKWHLAHVTWFFETRAVGLNLACAFLVCFRVTQQV